MAERTDFPSENEDDAQLPAHARLTAFHPLSPDLSWFEDYWLTERQPRRGPAVRIAAVVGVCAALAAGGSVVVHGYRLASVPASGPSLPIAD